MNITGLDKAMVLAALYNRAQPQGMGFLQYDPTPRTPADAEPYVSQAYFDYVKGRVMKIDLSHDDVGTSGYNRDNGDGAAEEVIATLRATQDVNALSEKHQTATQNQAAELRPHLNTKTTTRQEDGVFYVDLGIDDLAEPLWKALSRV